ncbi:hypothetical protein [Vibrio sp.]|uniref:hypothetical protein n=1 Tax=Vibrio sp. TaxID=678 RepID=UPI003AA81E01
MRMEPCPDIPAEGHGSITIASQVITWLQAHCLPEAGAALQNEMSGHHQRWRSSRVQHDDR